MTDGVGTSGMCGSGPAVNPIPVHALLWHNGSVTDLGSLAGAINNIAYAINEAGQIVGTSDLPGDTTAHAFRWRNGVMDPLGTLGGNNSFALGANNRGLVVGSAENSTQDPNCIPPQVLDYKPVVWHGDATHELPVLAGDAVGAVFAVNDNNPRRD